MDTKVRAEGRKNPQETSNFLSRLFFGWTIPILWKGARQDLKVTDLYSPLKSDESERLGDRLEKEWNEELRRADKELLPLKSGKKAKARRPSLIWALTRIFWVSYILQGLYFLVQSVILRVMQPIILSWIIGYFNPGQDRITKNQVLLDAGSLVIVNFSLVFLTHHTLLRCRRIGMCARVAVCSLIYRKVLRIDQGQMNNRAAGQVANLISNDVARFDAVVPYLNFIWIIPIQLSVVGYVMWQSVGIASVVGVAALILQTIPIEVLLSTVTAKLRSRIAVRTDNRIQLLSELISGVQAVKMYAWEKPFELIVSKIRELEIRLVSRMSYFRGFNISMNILASKISLYLTLVCFVLLGNRLTVEITFMLESLFNGLRFACAIFFPEAMITAGEAAASAERITDFLLLDEVKGTTQFEPAAHNDLEDWQKIRTDRRIRHGVRIEMVKVAANWVHGQLPPTLRDVSMEVRSGSLCAVVGPVASGKSSLLHLLLGELPVGAGKFTLLSGEDNKNHITVRDLRISYASQDPWIFSASVRDNILFGQPYDKKRYQEVTRVCALLRDFEQLPQGDLSLVGERGASLSGGQRARVNLARAVYRDADLYLLDDPLSAVDAHVSRHLFEECINGYLKDKTRILVTHQLQYLHRADTVVVLNNGTVERQHTFGEVDRTNLYILRSRLPEELYGVSHEKKACEDNEEYQTTTAESISVHHEKSEVSKGQTEVVDNTKEVMATGEMSSKVYWGYFLAGSNIYLLSFLGVIFIAGQVAFSGTDYWVTYWSNQETIRVELRSQNLDFPNNGTRESEWFDEFGLLSPRLAIYVYTFCILGSSFLVVTRSMLFMKTCMNSSRNIHASMLDNLLQATMRFFNTNPSGRVLNRFSKDIGTMDEYLPKIMLGLLQISNLVIGIFVMVAISNCWMILPGIVIGWIIFTVRGYYLKTAQRIQRLEGIARSPVFSHVNSTLDGLTTIRSRGAQAIRLLRKEFDIHQDGHSGAWYLTLGIASALALFLDILSCTFIGCLCLVFILLDDGDTSPGSVGLAISQSLMLIGIVQFGVRLSTEAITQMTSVERVLQYTELPKEGPFSGKNPPASPWPTNGALVFRNVTMRYAENKPPVLKSLNLSINPGWKVGIVGRTGAGKSSLISALFRLTGDGLEGEILLDGIDTKTAGLHELRPQISIIPQEPILFSGSLRYNLDPFEQYSDAQLWDSLREVELGDAVSSLDFQVAGGGANFSVGQRQLICLARAILRNNRVLVLDEATANVDQRTDALIQSTIRRRFADCTVLTIAHRLNTIMDSDRVLVMSEGRVVEFGHPHLLLKNSGGLFHRMLQQTGKPTAEKLARIAEDAYLTRSELEEESNDCTYLYWTIPILWKGARQDLKVTDLYSPLKSDESERLGDRLEKEWNEELRRADKELLLLKSGKKAKARRPSLIWALTRIFWVPCMLQGLYFLVQSVVLRVMQPILLSWIIGFFHPGQDRITKNQVLLDAGFLVIVNFSLVFLNHHTILRCRRIGMCVRVAVCSLIYRKVLRIDQGQMNNRGAGRVANLISNDVARFDTLFVFLNYIWIIPIQLSVVGYVMWQSVGIASVVGVAALILQTIPIEVLLSTVTAKLRSKIAVRTDNRIQLLSELISGVQAVKMYAWEKPFELIVSKIRALEIRLVSRMSYFRGFNISINILASKISLYLTLVCFVLLGNRLTVEITFMLESLFNGLRYACAIFFPEAMITAGEAAASAERITDFLLLDEVKGTTQFEPAAHNDLEDWQKIRTDRRIRHGVRIEMVKVAANWVHGQLPPTLRDVSMEVRSGSLCAVVGPVASGKSSLLHLLLGELPVGAGKFTLLSGEDNKNHITVRDLRISYASQDPWIFSASVRDNILFGQPYDKKRYQEVTRVCALLRDFEQLPQGDLSLVGERGASLSGGQRARVNLARAVYRDADLYLLDDPLSAVDAHVSRHLFEECIDGYLKDKTRILVTHQLQYLHRADTVVVLNNGTVKRQHTFEELDRTNPHVSKSRVLEELYGVSREKKACVDSEKYQSTELITEHREESEVSMSQTEVDNTEEVMATGEMSSKVYWGYFSAGGNISSLSFLVIIFIAGQVAFSGTDYWVTYWSNQETIRVELRSQNLDFPSNGTRESEWFDEFGLLSPRLAIYVYTFCILGSSFLVVMRNILFMRTCMNSSRNIHASMLDNLLQATMRFFNTNPSGRVLNRFSKDIGTMDEYLPKIMLVLLQVLNLVIGIFVVVVISNYWMILPEIVIGWIIFTVRGYYLKTAQQIQRLEGIAKSPVFSHVNSTLDGLTTIRSRGAQAVRLLRKEFDIHQDGHSGAWYLSIGTATAFGLLVDTMSCTFIGCLCFVFILLDDGDTLPGSVGLAISQSLMLIGIVQFGVRMSTEAITQMTSVERVLQYTELPKEGPFSGKNPPASPWPTKGALVFRNVTMRYAENKPPVLKSLNLSINPGWKVGIVGRTGAGKSSLISALFRLTGDGLEGEILLDGIDTKTAGLHELRPQISIIPQEPILFSGSLRYNLDPFEQYSDAQLWDSLREVELGDAVSSLDFQVAGGGANFSVGQRQLICLARAILRNNRVLVLDEATANVDQRTDALIQTTIRRRFADCTVLTIAHRLNTIMDSDRVLVMSEGRVVEFGHPHLLLRNSSGLFHRMLQQTGKSTAEKLARIAEDAYLTRSELTEVSNDRTIDVTTDDCITRSSGTHCNNRQ